MLKHVWYECRYCGNTRLYPDDTIEEKHLCKYCKHDMIISDTKFPTNPDRYQRDVQREVFIKYISGNTDKEKPYNRRVQTIKHIEQQELKQRHNELKKQYKDGAANQNTPKCPTCGSISLRKIDGLERGVSVVAWGLFSSKINKTFKCNSCGYTW